jgi:poly-gamma-glutamate biosynthesis protein PgsC/CapC
MIFETLLIGILVALIFSEVFDIYPGGIIVPAYFALYFDSPFRIVATLFVAFLSLFLYRILSRRFILFGKRRFVVLIFLGVFWAQLLSFVFPVFFAASFELRVIGWIIPGLLANNLEKQRIVPTLAALFSVSVTAYFLIRILDWILG